jgi:choline-sulfatase
MQLFSNRVHLAAVCTSVIALSFAMVGDGLGGYTRPPSEDAPDSLSSSTPVILISIDTLRADHLSAYGYRRISTPHIDSFARGGTLFTKVACQTPLTLPSHTTLLTSTYPFENGIQENAQIVPSGAVTLAGILKSHRYKTGAFIGCAFLERQMGLDQGFDTYDSPFNFEAFSPISGEMFAGGTAGQYQVHDRRDGALVLGAALRWLNANRGQSVFAFIHFFDLHAPYRVPQEKARAQGIPHYDAELESVDDLIGRLKNALEQTGWWGKSLVVLVSDHGEGLGDHGEDSHGYFIYQSTLQVPLIIHWPAGTRTATLLAARQSAILPAGLIDVAPTILDLLHIPKPPSFSGTSLLAAAPHAVYSETMHTHDSFGWAPLRSVRVGNLKYIEAPKPELYDLKHDPMEHQNIVLTRSADARTLRAELSKVLTAYPRRPSSNKRPTGSTPDSERLLTSLGYLAQGPGGRAGSNADPKDRLAEFKLYEKAMAHFGEGRPAQAAPLLNQVLAEDPMNTLARRDLGAVYLDLHDYENARASFMKVVVAAPDDYATHFGLGIAAKHLGHSDEARTHFETACKLAPKAMQCRLELEALKDQRK